MGVYAVTGGSGGIGAAVVELLKKNGNEVINIDLKNGDICANLATVEGRQAAIDGLYERCPDGLDGIVCNAGVSGSCGNYELVISLNYFGTVKLARGVYELLKKKHGSVVVTVSNTISQGTGRMDIVDLLNNVGDEQRIRSIVSTRHSQPDSRTVNVHGNQVRSRPLGKTNLRFMGCQRCPCKRSRSGKCKNSHDRQPK